VVVPQANLTPRRSILGGVNQMLALADHLGNRRYFNAYDRWRVGCEMCEMAGAWVFLDSGCGGGVSRIQILRPEYATATKRKPPCKEIMETDETKYLKSP